MCAAEEERSGASVASSPRPSRRFRRSTPESTPTPASTGAGNSRRPANAATRVARARRTIGRMDAIERREKRRGARVRCRAVRRFASSAPPAREEAQPEALLPLQASDSRQHSADATRPARAAARPHAKDERMRGVKPRAAPGSSVCSSERDGLGQRETQTPNRRREDKEPDGKVRAALRHESRTVRSAPRGDKQPEIAR